MGRPELGTKCTCASCGERFYDLRRSPAMCPKCGAEQPPEKLHPLRAPRTMVSRRPPPQPDPVIAEDEVEVADTADAEDEEDVADLQDETDVEIDLDPDRSKTPD